MIDWVGFIGIVAGICTTLAIIPQILKAWQTKEVKDISKGMFAILITGVSLWTIYGILINDMAIILANGVSVLLNSSLLYILIRYKRGNTKPTTSNKH
jgi:MtN3 and saliva related transmembrane protein